MDMESRNQYLASLQKEYLRSSKKEKGLLLAEATKRTGLHRKHIVMKLSPKTSHVVRPRNKRAAVYDGEVTAALVKLWEIFDYPCGQRLAPLLATEVRRLRQFRELLVTDEVAIKLCAMSPKTIDRLLAHEKSVRCQNKKMEQKKHPWLYAQIPMKGSSDFDRSLPGQIQIDAVEHCGASSSGEYISTVVATDIATGWWEGEVAMGKSQKVAFTALTTIRLRSPISWIEIHPDNGTMFINWHLYEYTRQEELAFSRSRPYHKNDNCFIEQKNSTHVRKVVGYCRYDTRAEQTLLTDLYRNELRLYKNFFQSVMKLEQKIREKGKVHRTYDKAKTPYHRILGSNEIPLATKQALTAVYERLNPAELKRQIEAKLKLLHQIYQTKQQNPSQETRKVRPRFSKKIYDPTLTISVR